ncbi:hypothetical protein P7K49_015661 [Saguinus oedipus]|uniref:Uncharacterized protein n=1 Tax=Saguinus oedipus TaxID=9490 RepID=A0ABQ9VCR7_SAGOE|nr:hypothetical protein P7K49_015661 [Saguinus oedipus]
MLGQPQRFDLEPPAHQGPCPQRGKGPDRSWSDPQAPPPCGLPALEGSPLSADIGQFVVSEVK